MPFATVSWPDLLYASYPSISGRRFVAISRRDALCSRQPAGCTLYFSVCGMYSLSDSRRNARCNRQSAGCSVTVGRRDTFYPPVCGMRNALCNRQSAGCTSYGSVSGIHFLTHQSAGHTLEPPVGGMDAVRSRESAGCPLYPSLAGMPFVTGTR